MQKIAKKFCKKSLLKSWLTIFAWLWFNKNAQLESFAFVYLCLRHKSDAVPEKKRQRVKQLQELEESILIEQKAFQFEDFQRELQDETVSSEILLFKELLTPNRTAIVVKLATPTQLF